MRARESERGTGEGGEAIRFRDPKEWLITALCQFDCDSLRSVEGRECEVREERRGGVILRTKGELHYV